MPGAKNKTSRQKSLSINVTSDSESDNSEHELSYYMKDKVKLMKEVLKIIKPKKIKSMAPGCIKNLDLVEINSMLLEELLGISNKRLQYIFNGENVDRETSSSDSEEEKKPIDVISLDDISDDDVIEFYDDNNKKEQLNDSCSLPKKSKKHKTHKIKVEEADPHIKVENNKVKKIKKEKKIQSKPSKEDEKNKLMSVLELLELQARARAIRSQLALENEKRKDSENHNIEIKDDSDPEAVIIESPKNKEIVITSSDSETDILPEPNSNDAPVPPEKKSKPNDNREKDNSEAETSDNNQDGESDKLRKEKLLAKIQKIRLVRNKTTAQNQTDPGTGGESSNDLKSDADLIVDILKERATTPPSETSEKTTNIQEPSKKVEKDSIPCCDDEIVINLDEDEMDGIENIE